jgi:hypothetical protein
VENLQQCDNGTGCDHQPKRTSLHKQIPILVSRSCDLFILQFHSITFVSPNCFQPLDACLNFMPPTQPDAGFHNILKLLTAPFNG